MTATPDPGSELMAMSHDQMTRAEIIGGLKKQGFLIAQGKNIVPTETGLSLFGQVDGEAEGDRGRVDFLEQRHEAPQER